jgi:hypothetical protein
MQRPGLPACQAEANQDSSLFALPCTGANAPNSVSSALFTVLAQPLSIPTWALSSVYRANAPCQSARNDFATIGVDPRLTLCKLQGAFQVEHQLQNLTPARKTLQMHTVVDIYSSR